MSEAFNVDGPAGNRSGDQSDGPLDGMRPARLAVGIISAGRVGTALGVALDNIGLGLALGTAIGSGLGVALMGAVNAKAKPAKKGDGSDGGYYPNG